MTTAFLDLLRFDPLSLKSFFLIMKKTMPKKLINIAHQSIRLTIMHRLMYRHIKKEKTEIFQNFLSGIRVSCPTFAFRPVFYFH
jgi:hypothetical protein